MSKANLTKVKEAEAAVVGAILLRNDAIDDVRCVVQPDDFDTPAYRAAYEAMLGIVKDGISSPGAKDGVKKEFAIDSVTLEHAMAAAGTLSLIGGMEGVSKLSDRYPSSANVLRHAEIVRDAKRRRDIIEHAHELIEAARQDSDSHAGQIAEAWASKLGHLAEGRQRLYTGGEVAQLAVDQGEARMRGEVGSEPLSTGLTKLDAAIGGGLEPATVIMVCARPGNGKTSLTTCMQLAIARGGGAIFGKQMDMGALQTGRRLLAVATPMHLQSIKHPRKTATVDALRAAQEELESLSLTFCTRKCTAREARAQIREWRRKTKGKRGAVFIDYLQQHRSEQKGHDRHDLDLADWVGEYKGLAEELEIPVVICSQLNRKVEERDDKRPRMSDVRDSGQIEEYADTMLGLYREARYNEYADKLAAEIIVLKHRDEPTSTVKVHFEGWYARFIDAPEQDDSPRDDAPWPDDDEKKPRKQYRNPRKYAANPD